MASLNLDSRRPGSWIHVKGFDESDSPLVIAMAYAGVRMKHGLRAPEKASVEPASSVPMRDDEAAYERSSSGKVFSPPAPMSGDTAA
jgi:hypothetical protein